MPPEQIAPQAYERKGDLTLVEEIAWLIKHEPQFEKKPQAFLRHSEYARDALVWQRVLDDKATGESIGKRAAAVAKLVRMKGFDRLSSTIIGLPNADPKSEELDRVQNFLIDLDGMARAFKAKEFETVTQDQAAIIYQNHVLTTSAGQPDRVYDWSSLADDLYLAGAAEPPLRRHHASKSPDVTPPTGNESKPEASPSTTDWVERTPGSEGGKSSRAIGIAMRSLFKGCENCGLFKALGVEATDPDFYSSARGYLKQDIPTR